MSKIVYGVKLTREELDRIQVSKLPDKFFDNWFFSSDKDILCCKEAVIGTIVNVIPQNSISEVNFRKPPNEIEILYLLYSLDIRKKPSWYIIG